MPDWPTTLPTGVASGWGSIIEIGALDAAGDSRISEYGPTLPDFGIVQKIAGLIKPGLLRDCALGGAYHSWPDGGNGTLGDGGWAHIANEFDRQEQSGNRYNSTITQTQAAGVSSYTVASVTQGAAPVAGEWLVIGAGANTEIVQVAQNWNGASPITFASATTQAHTSGDPIYHACRNEGYLAKSALVVLCAEGINDLGKLGPGAPPSPLANNWQSGTFGTTIGASRGLTPLMQALRFSIANFRCSVIYRDTHPSVVYGANWTSLAVTSTASYPTLYTFGGNNGNYHYATVAGATLTFSTAPDFPGGTVVVFVMMGSSGQGAVWDYSVSGATTVAMTAHATNSAYDIRNVNPMVMNQAAGVGAVGCGCFRITGLNAGVNTVTVKATTLQSAVGPFLGWGIEAPNPPLVFALKPSRTPVLPQGTGYGTRALGAITGATVAAGAGTAAGSVAFVGGTLALGVAGTQSSTAAQINDTITLDKGTANEETRRIVGYTGSPATACQVDANFANAHTGSPVVIGVQDADYVGGGYFNQADTQGAISVPGCSGAIQVVVGEFDSNVVGLEIDPLVNPPGRGAAVNPLSFYADGVHYNDQGSGLVTAGLVQAILAYSWALSTLATAAVPDKRTWQGVYGDVGATPTPSTVVTAFQNAWTNVFSSTLANATTYPRTRFVKDPRTREVAVEIAATGGGGNGSVIFTMPVGYRPAATVAFYATTINEDGTYGVADVTIASSGAVTCQFGYPGATGALMMVGTYPAEQ